MYIFINLSAPRPQDKRALSGENLSLLHANIKGAVQSMHLLSLISTVVILYLERIISKITIFYNLVSDAKQSGLGLT